MKISTIHIRNNPFFFGFLLSLFLSALILSLSLILPTFASSNYYQKSLTQLRKQAKAIKSEFAALISEIKQKQKLIPVSSFPKNKNEIFGLFKKLNLDKEKEGIGYYDSRGNLILWLGNVFDLEPIFSGEKRENQLEYQSSLLIRDKASSYFVFFHKINRSNYLVFYRLLAFMPHLKSPYLKEYQFLKPKLLSNCIIEYRDFREDVSGYENLFARHKDEYIGQPKLQAKVQTIFFPLRNEKNKIIATITLRSPPLSANLFAQREDIFLAFYLMLGISLVFLLFYLVKTSSFYRKRKFLALLGVILILIGLRAIFMPLSRLEKVQSLPFFSPSASSFLSFYGLTKSPSDIFLTSLFLFLLLLSFRVFSQKLFEKKKRKIVFPITLLANLVLILVAICLVFIFQELLFSLVFNSNLNLLHFSLNISFFLLHLSILLFFLGFSLAILLGMRIVSVLSSSILLPLLVFVIEFGAYFLLFKTRNIPFLFGLQALIVLSVFAISLFPWILRKKEVLFSCFLLSVLFIYSSLQFATSARTQTLIQHSLQNIIKSQEHWGNFLIRQSLPQIEKNDDSIISFLQNHEPANFAHSIWEKTLIAKFNWYSSLEIQTSEGILLSRFSLNVPSLYRLEYQLPLSQEWTILPQNIPFMGKEKDFLIAYKDWFEENDYLGRMILYLSIDYDMLPFLYSANPYFDLLRVSSIPSLNQFELGFAIFDLSGKLLFNPNKIYSGIPPYLLEKITSSPKPIWMNFQDKKKKFDGFYFRNNNRIYFLFLPEKNFFDHSVEFLKLFFFYLILSFLFFILVLLISRKRKWQNPFWSFSNRVYISFFAVAIIPLLLFTFFTRSFFSRIFSQQFTEKAEIHATLAQGIMEDLAFLQQQEQLSPTLPPENDVLWISSTISNDVNLYQDGKLVSSSRREFFDSGLFPELIDGEIYYKIQYENNPFYTQTQKIGDYSFHTLTIPYLLGSKHLLISLPFPLEQQEISEATKELLEFLFFISVFFGAVVLFFARGIGGMIITPIKKLLVGTKEVSMGNLEISIQHRSKDEMKTLIDGFNAMVKNLKKHQQELAEMGKKVAWAEMARKVAHEIKNPLTPIQLSAEHILRVYEDKPEDFEHILKESASYIIKEVENLRKIAQEFLEISKETSLHKELIDLREIIQETVEPYKKILSERIKFKESYQGKDFRLWADKAKLKIALRNIITNAIEAIRKQGKIEIKASKEKTGIRLEIKDTGMGIRETLVGKIFEPYFSTKDVGTGLGLSIAKKIIESHGGTIQASSREGKGTKILISLPG